MKKVLSFLLINLLIFQLVACKQTEKSTKENTTTTTTQQEENDNTAPVITASDKTIMIGSNFDALDGVTATDNLDGTVTVEVVSSNVNTNAVGEYSVIYKSIDSSGNISNKTIKVIVKRLDLSDVDSYELFDAKGIVFMSQENKTNLSSTNKDNYLKNMTNTETLSTTDTSNTIYKYNDNGELEVVKLVDKNGNYILQQHMPRVRQIFDLGSKLMIIYDNDDNSWTLDDHAPLQNTVFVDKTTGKAYMVDTTQINAYIYLFEYYKNIKPIYTDLSDNIYIYIFNYNDNYNVINGFYKVSFTENTATLDLIFEHTNTASLSPFYLIDIYGNITYEDSGISWKVYSTNGRLSTVAPNTFNIMSFLDSKGRLHNQDMMLDEDGLSTTKYTNTEGIIYYNDLISYEQNSTYIANSQGIIYYDEQSTDLDNNVKYFYPENYNIPSSDYNELLIIGKTAYIATNMGITQINLDLNNLTYKDNILDDIYVVKEIKLIDNYLLFTGKDPYLNNIVAKYDLDTKTVTIVENQGKAEASFKLININKVDVIFSGIDTIETNYSVFSTAPNWTNLVTATDSSGNSFDISVKTNINMNIVGTYQVVYTASLDGVAKDMYMLTVDVVDTIKPTIGAVSTLPTTLEVNSSLPRWADYITANDNYDGDIIITSGMVDTSKVNMAQTGTFDVVYTVTDSSGNASTYTITFTIQDTTGPEIIVNSTLLTTFKKGSAEPNWLEYISATDNYDGDIIITQDMVNTTNVNMTAVGTFDVLYTVVDNNNNQSTYTLTITIEA